MTRITTLRISDEQTGRLKELRCMRCLTSRPCVSVSDLIDECEYYVVLGGNEYCTQEDDE